MGQPHVVTQNDMRRVWIGVGRQGSLLCARHLTPSSPGILQQTYEKGHCHLISQLKKLRLEM